MKKSTRSRYFDNSLPVYPKRLFSSLCLPPKKAIMYVISRHAWHVKWSKQGYKQIWIKNQTAMMFPVVFHRSFFLHVVPFVAPEIPVSSSNLNLSSHTRLFYSSSFYFFLRHFTCLYLLTTREATSTAAQIGQYSVLLVFAVSLSLFCCFFCFSWRVAIL